MTFFVPESPKFLHAKGRYEELVAYLNESAKQNGINFKIEESLTLNNISKNKRSDDKNPKTLNCQPDYSAWNNLQDLKILNNFVVTVLIFAFVTYNYYMMGLYMKYATGDIFVNTLLTTISEIIGYFSATVLFKLVGIKLSFVMSSSLSIIFGIPMLFDIPVWIASLCLVLARFGIQLAFPSIHYLGNSGLFNPLLVPLLYTMENLVAKLLTIFAPQIVELPKPIPMISFVVISFGIFV